MRVRNINNKSLGIVIKSNTCSSICCKGFSIRSVMAEEDYPNAKTSVWWDIENCNVPKGVDPHSIAQNISSALSKLDYRGPVSITAYGDTKFLPARVQHALSSTGIALNHVPSGVKDASDKKILVDMLFWAVDNPAPANYLLISGDRDFSNALHRLRMRRYNILLARPTQNVSAPLIGAAKSVWLWTSLARGEPALQNSPTDTEEVDKWHDSSPSENGARAESLEMRHSISEPNLNHPVSQGMQSVPGVRTRNMSIESNFQQSGQFQMNRSDDIAMPMVSNGQGGNSIYYSGTKAPSVTSEGGFPLHPHGNMLEKFKDMRPFSSPQSSTNVKLDYNSGVPIASDPRASFNQSMKSSSFPAALGNNYAGNQFQPTVRPPFVSKPRPGIHSQMTSNMSTDNFPVVRPNFPSDWRAAESQQSYNLQAAYAGSNQNLQHLPPEQKSTYPVNFMPNTSPQENCREAVHFPSSKWLLPPEHTPTVRMDCPEFRIRIVLKAIDTLKQNMMVPTEANIEDCIRYGEVHNSSFNIRESLEKAIDLKEIVVMRGGGGLPLYLPYNVHLWKCMDPLNMHDNYPKEAWEEFRIFLSSFEGQQAMMSSQRRYHAALILKSSCLKKFALGEIIHMLQLAINLRRWLRPHNSGWQPLSVTLGQCDKSWNPGVNAGNHFAR
eukprot:Gb_11975 [translate_table: standard]